MSWWISQRAFDGRDQHLFQIKMISQWHSEIFCTLQYVGSLSSSQACRSQRSPWGGAKSCTTSCVRLSPSHHVFKPGSLVTNKYQTIVQSINKKKTCAYISFCGHNVTTWGGTPAHTFAKLKYQRIRCSTPPNNNMAKLNSHVCVQKIWKPSID